MNDESLEPEFGEDARLAVLETLMENGQYQRGFEFSRELLADDPKIWKGIGCCMNQ